MPNYRNSFSSFPNFFKFLLSDDLIEGLMKLGILKPENWCQKCGNQMMLQFYKKSIDGKVWRCKKKACRNTNSVKADSFFTEFKLPIKSVLVVIYEWAEGINIKKIARDSHLNRKTVSRILKVIRRLISLNFMITSNKIGGNGRIVEIDEMLCTRRKYNRGRVIPQQWVLGGIDRDTKAFFMVEIPDRTSLTLERIIESHVEMGTTIYTDEWRGYSGLTGMGYQHETVCHSRYFLNPDNRLVHTQTIEGQWRWVRHFIKTKGASFSHFREDYILEYEFRRGRNVLKTFLSYVCSNWGRVFRIE